MLIDHFECMDDFLDMNPFPMYLSPFLVISQRSHVDGLGFEMKYCWGDVECKVDRDGDDGHATINQNLGKNADIKLKAINKNKFG